LIIYDSRMYVKNYVPLLIYVDLTCFDPKWDHLQGYSKVKVTQTVLTILYMLQSVKYVTDSQ
jgi:hypothetical protein